MEEKIKKFRKFVAKTLATFIANKILSVLISTTLVANLWALFTGKVQESITFLAQKPITQLPLDLAIVLLSVFLLYTLITIVASDYFISRYRSKKDVILLVDDDIKFAYYANVGSLDPFPFCKKDEIRMNEIRAGVYKCGECGKEIQITTFSADYSYRMNSAISKAEKILRGRKKGNA